MVQIGTKRMGHMAEGGIAHHTGYRVCMRCAGMGFNRNRVRSERSQPQVSRREAVAAVSAALLASCHSGHGDTSPSIEFTRIPQADPGGREKNDIIEGTATHARAGHQIVLYAKSGKWWVQPLVNHPFTRLQENSKWTNATHLGTEYAALLVEPGYRPVPVINALPRPGGNVVAVATVPGQKNPPSVTIRFSGYEWRVRDAPSSRGGLNRYDPANVSTDDNGAMHLRISRSAPDWTCAEVALTRSLGYGTYRWVVRDTSHLEPAAVFGMFTWDYSGGDQGNREMDIEISRWGEPSSKNAQYVVQPYYVAANVARFTIPPGTLTHSFRWEQGRLSFRTTRGRENGEQTPAVAEHVFTSGVPSPGIESIRMNLYVNRNSGSTMRNGAEVVIEHFEYLP